MKVLFVTATRKKKIIEIQLSKIPKEEIEQLRKDLNLNHIDENIYSIQKIPSKKRKEE